MGPEIGASINATAVNANLRNPIGGNVRNPLATMGSSLGDKYFHDNAAGLFGGVSASWEPDFGKKQADVDSATQSRRPSRRMACSTNASQYGCG